MPPEEDYPPGFVDAAHRVITQAIKDGLIERGDGPGKLRITEKGRAYLEAEFLRAEGIRPN